MFVIESETAIQLPQSNVVSAIKTYKMKSSGFRLIFVDVPGKRHRILTEKVLWCPVQLLFQP